MLDKKPKSLFLIISLTIAISVIFLLIVNIDKLLVVKDDLHSSSIIIVPTGEPQIRVPHAVDLFYEGYAKKILFVNSINSNSYHNFQILRGQKIPIGKAYFNKTMAIGLGVPEKNIIILEGNAQSTLDEAIICREYFKNHLEINSIILVTSIFHSGRSKIIFKKVLGSLGRNIKIYSSPSKYDNSNAGQWWHNKKDLLWIIREFAALLLFYFRSMFFLH